MISARQSEESRPPLSMLIAHSLLVLLEREVPQQLDKLLHSLERNATLKRYPDGSLLLDEMDSIEEFCAAIYRRCPDAAQLGAKDIFRSLAPFPVRYYEIHFPSDYYESMMPGSVHCRSKRNQ